MQRAAARAAAAAAGLVALQAAALAATYETPLDAGGPHLGVCSPLLPPPPCAAPLRVEYARARLPGAAATRARCWQQPRRAHDADEAAPALRTRGESGGQHGALAAPTRGAAGSGAGGGVRCIVLGDSLVSGVGSSVGGSPALPQRFAAALAERLGAQVTWRALGKTGADVAAIRAALLPRLRAEAAAHAEQGGAPTVLLLLCGLNDFKRAHRGATSAAFHDALAELVADICDICGPHTLVVLPALPLAATARFPVPLHWLVCALGARYDAQKRKLAERFAGGGSRVLFVDAPQLPAAAEVPQLLSRDGVHPNDLGYARWGAHIADAVALHLLRARGAGSAAQP
jgi:lysophospholipase L1-like esterase